MSTLVAGPSDLVRDALGGDAAALDALVRRHLPAVTAVCRRRLRRSHDVDDAVQEAFARGLRSLDRLEDPERVGAWLCRIAERVSLDLLRAGRAGTVVIDPWLEGPEVADPEHPELIALRREEAKTVHDSLQALSERSSRALWLRDALGAPVSEVASELGVTEGSARVLLCRARQQLRQAWGAVAAFGLLVWGSLVSRAARPRPALAAHLPSLVPAAAVAVASALVPGVAMSGPDAALAPAPPAVVEHVGTDAVAPVDVAPRADASAPAVGAGAAEAGGATSAAAPVIVPDAAPAPPASTTIGAVTVSDSAPQGSQPTTSIGTEPDQRDEEPALDAELFADDVVGSDVALPDVTVPEAPAESTGVEVSLP